MNIEGNFEATLWRHRWRHHHGKTFGGINWNDIFISEVKLKLCLIFQFFSNDRHFELATYINFRIWPTLWPGDVINDVMNMYLFKCSHKLMILTHRKFNADIFACYLVIMKTVVISFIKEYRGPTLRLPCDVIYDVIIMKKLEIIKNNKKTIKYWGQLCRILRWGQAWQGEQLSDHPCSVKYQTVPSEVLFLCWGMVH